MDLTQSTKPIFDQKYVTTISFQSTPWNTEKFMWLDENFVKKSVDVKFCGETVYVGFEDENDALIFKIKFL